MLENKLQHVNEQIDLIENDGDVVMLNGGPMPKNEMLAFQQNRKQIIEELIAASTEERYTRAETVLSAFVVTPSLELRAELDLILLALDLTLEEFFTHLQMGAFNNG